LDARHGSALAKYAGSVGNSCSVFLGRSWFILLIVDFDLMQNPDWFELEIGVITTNRFFFIVGDDKVGVNCRL